MAETLSASGVLDAANDYVRLGCAGMGGVSIQVQGTFSGTITFEGTIQGQAFSALLVLPIGSTTAVTTTTTTGIWTGSAVGLTSIQARMSSYSSGAATVLIRTSVAAPGGSSSGGGGGGDVNLVEVGGDPIALGQTTAANSLPVVFPSDTPIEVSVPDGDDATLGAIADAKVTGDMPGTVSAKLRGLDYLQALVTDTVNNRVNVYVQNTSIPVDTNNPLPYGADAVTYTATSPTVDTFDYKTGGTGGIIVATNTVTYTDSSHDVLVSSVWT